MRANFPRRADPEQWDNADGMKDYHRARTSEERRRRTIAAIPGAILVAVAVLGLVLDTRFVTGHDSTWVGVVAVVAVLVVGLALERRDGTRGQ